MEALKAGYTGIGGVQLKMVPLSKDALDLVKAYGAIAMAGQAAEKIAFDKIEGGKDDLRWFERQLKQLDLNVSQYEQEASLKAKRLLKENWDAYLALIDAMKNRESVASCEAAIASKQTVSKAA